MNQTRFIEETDLNWLNHQIKIAHLVSESKIKEKQIELSNYLINNDTYLLSREKIQSKHIRRISEEISRLRSEVLYLEKDLSEIEEKKRNIILSTKTESSKTINSIQIDMIKDNQKIDKLKHDIEKQRDAFMIEINDAKKEKEEILNDYDQVISDLWQDIKQTEIQLFSSSKKSILRSMSEFSTNPFDPQLLSSFYDHKEFLEMQSACSFLNSELDDVNKSIQNIQNKIENETINREQLNIRLNEIEDLSTDYRNEISNLHNQHRKIKTELDEISSNQWTQTETTVFNIK